LLEGMELPRSPSNPRLIEGGRGAATLSAVIGRRNRVRSPSIMIKTSPSAVRPLDAARSARREGDDAYGHRFHVSTAIERNDHDPAVSRAVVRAQAGDHEAIRFLYLRYKNNVYGYVLSMLRDEYEAEDVTQHVFMKLMRVIGKYEPREVPFTSWILRVARNVAVDHLRQRRPIPAEEILDHSEPSYDVSVDRRWGLEQALEALPEDQRGVVVLRHLVGLTPGEIAERMGRTEASIHGLHHRARHTLRGELSAIGCAPTVCAA
jgi:RNA polymerase sigma-70 factor, ECF subfamily